MRFPKPLVVWPFRHFGLKLLSLGLALLVWMVVSGEETVERGLRVPLELQQVPPGLELLDEVPATVDVRVRGASGALGRVGAARLTEGRPTGRACGAGPLAARCCSQ